MNDFVIERDPETDEKVKRELTNEEQALRDAAALPSSDPNDYLLNGIKFRELLFDPIRRADVKTQLDTLSAAQRGKADAYLEGSTLFRWSDTQVVWMAANLTEGASAFEAAWVSKGQE